MKTTNWIVGSIIFIACMSAIAYFLPDEDEQGGSAVLLVIFTGGIALFFVLIAFTKKLDWMYKKPFKKD